MDLESLILAPAIRGKDPVSLLYNTLEGPRESRGRSSVIIEVMFLRGDKSHWSISLTVVLVDSRGFHGTRKETWEGRQMGSRKPLCLDLTIIDGTGCQSLEIPKLRPEGNEFGYSSMSSGHPRILRTVIEKTDQSHVLTLIDVAEL